MATATPTRRGPYRRRSHLRVEDASWRRGDVVQVDGVRWIIRSLTGTDKTPPAKREVVLHSSNTINHLVVWTTTLALIPKKESNR